MAKTICIEESEIYERIPEAKKSLESSIGLYRATQQFGVDPIRGQRTKEGSIVYGALEEFVAVYNLVRDRVWNLFDGDVQRREELVDLYSIYIGSKYGSERIEGSYKGIRLEERLDGFFNVGINIDFKSYDYRTRKEILMNRLLAETYIRKVKNVAREASTWENITLSFFHWILNRAKEQMLEDKYAEFHEELKDIKGSVGLVQFSGLDFHYGRRVSDVSNYTTLNDVGGNKAAKREIRSVIDYYRYREVYESWAAEVPRGILLIGPSGTGKTLLARAMACEIGEDFHEVKCSDILDPFVGKSEQRLKYLLSMGGVIFLDEFDAIGRRRGGSNQDYVDRLVNELLIHMGGLSSRNDQIFLGASNNEGLIDGAFKRPGRFDYTIRINLPDYEDLMEILRIHTSQREQRVGRELFSGIDYSTIVSAMTNFSGADVEQVVNRILKKKAEEEVRGKKGQIDLDVPLPTTEEFLEVIEAYRIEKRKDG